MANQEAFTARRLGYHDNERDNYWLLPMNQLSTSGYCCNPETVTAGHILLLIKGLTVTHQRLIAKRPTVTAG